MLFLDVQVEHCDSGTVIHKKQKPMHTGVYSNWSSFFSWNYKRNLVKLAFETSLCNSQFLQNYERTFPTY